VTIHVLASFTVQAVFPDDPFASRYVLVRGETSDEEKIGVGMNPAAARALARALIESAFCVDHGVNPALFPDGRIPG
jgi:hypothetical protein